MKLTAGYLQEPQRDPSAAEGTHDRCLGNHVEQKGSMWTRDRLRFDFSHFSGNDSGGDRKGRGNLVNQEISGSAAGSDGGDELWRRQRRPELWLLFGEKYGEKCACRYRWATSPDGALRRYPCGEYLSRSRPSRLYLRQASRQVCAGLRH